MLSQVVFWTTLSLIVYTYAGFPLLLLLRSLRKRPCAKRDVTPTVSFIVIAHNEEASIAAKLDNVLGLDYPAECIEIIVGSDGSDDATNDIAGRYADRGVTLCAFSRRGKVAALNAVVPLARGEVLVFSDANSMLLPGALRQLVRSLADPSVGAVAGNQRYSSDHGNAASVGERLYWAFDRQLKQMQSAAANVTSATGAIHAVRRSLFRPVPPGVSDDFVISTRVIAAGYRLVFEPAAIACEAVAPSDGAEYGRKARVIARGLRGLWAVKELFNPLRYGFYSLQLATHKLLRWSVCWLMLLLLLSSAVLVGTAPWYDCLFAAQIVLYGCAVTGVLLRKTPLVSARAFKLLALPLYFCLVNVAAFSGWLQLLSGRRRDVWNNTRSSSPDEPQPNWN